MKVKTPLVFLDTETCGLKLEDPIWEVAALRLDLDGTMTMTQFFVEHDRDPVLSLPEPFRSDHDARFVPARAKTIDWAAAEVMEIFKPDGRGNKPHLVGANPAFDAYRIEVQFGVSPWHYHIINVEDLALGYLTAKGQHPPIPWSSDDLAERLNINTSRYARHTAMDDVLWVRDIFFAVMAG